MDLKRVLPTGVAVVSTIAAGVCAFGWYTSATWGEEEAFSSCKDLGGLVELTYTYGSGDVLRFTQDPRGMDVTLSYQVKQAPLHATARVDGGPAAHGCGALALRTGVREWA